MVFLPPASLVRRGAGLVLAVALLAAPVAVRAEVQDELDVYNALLPHGGELSATLLIEITEAERMQYWLDQFMGLDQGQTVGLRAGTEQVFGVFEGGHSHETKISAVHFVRFRPTSGMVAAIKDPSARVTLSVSHREYREEVEVPWVLRQEWLADLGVDDTP